MIEHKVNVTKLVSGVTPRFAHRACQCIRRHNLRSSGKWQRQIRLLDNDSVYPGPL